FYQPRNTQIIETIFARLQGDIDGITFFHDKPLQSRRDFNHFINTDTALVPTLAAIAAHRTVQLESADLFFWKSFLEQHVTRHINFLLAARAKLACQSLRDN